MTSLAAAAALPLTVGGCNSFQINDEQVNASGLQVNRTL